VAEADQISAWIVLFMGLYSLGAGVGELRSPGSWAAMLDGFENNEALRFLTGIVLLAIGAAIYLVNPWNPEDWMSIMVTVIGGGMALEGVVVLGFGRPYLHFASKLLGKIDIIWAWLALVLGVAAVCAALLRF